MARMSIDQYHQIIGESSVLDVGIFPFACGFLCPLQHPIYLIEVNVAEKR